MPGPLSAVSRRKNRARASRDVQRVPPTWMRIAKASLEILGEEGADGLTVQAIVQRAGSSVGSFYARFDGKEDLLDYLGE